VGEPPDRRELFIGSFDFDLCSAYINAERGVIIRPAENPTAGLIAAYGIFAAGFTRLSSSATCGPPGKLCRISARLAGGVQ